MSEAWQQHAVAPPPVVHTIAPGAENALGCAVYGIVLQPDATSLQQQQHAQHGQHGQQHSGSQQHGGGQHSQQQHPAQAQQTSLQVGTEGHKCGACGHDISHLANPHEHQCMVSQDRSFQCTQCMKIFHQATDLLEHQCVQVEQKPFVCGVCKMGFSLLTSLAQHHTSHNSANPMKCSICEKTYRPGSSGNVTPTSNTPQQPNSDGASASSSSSILPFPSHVHGMDNLFKCASCQKEFSQSGELLRHKCGESSNSSPDKPYKCDVCGKGYKKSSTLQRHQNSHCQEKPLKCSLCDRRFLSSSEFVQHRCDPFHPSFFSFLLFLPQPRRCLVSEDWRV
ncbi:zinc finger protein 319 [Scomber scombrus]